MQLTSSIPSALSSMDRPGGKGDRGIGRKKMKYKIRVGKPTLVQGRHVLNGRQLHISGFPFVAAIPPQYRVQNKRGQDERGAEYTVASQKEADPEKYEERERTGEVRESQRQRGKKSAFVTTAHLPIQRECGRGLGDSQGGLQSPQSPYPAP